MRLASVVEAAAMAFQNAVEEVPRNKQFKKENVQENRNSIQFLKYKFRKNEEAKKKRDEERMELEKRNVQTIEKLAPVFSAIDNYCILLNKFSQ